MRGTIVRVPAAHHGDVRLRGRFVVERKWILNAYDPARRQCRAQRITRQLDRGCMRAALWLGDDQLPADELQRLALERANVDQPLVFHAAPALRGEGGWLHDCSVATRLCMVNVWEG